jgi:hypothetical protein
MNIKERLREHIAKQAVGSVWYQVSIDALTEIERLEKIPVAIRALRRYSISQGVVIDEYPELLLKWDEVETILKNAG